MENFGKYTVSVLLKKWNLKDGKIETPTIKNLKKQIWTFHKKLKKNGNVYTEYTLERNPDYHVHLLIHCNNNSSIYEQLERFIGGDSWIIREDGFDICNGKYGYVHVNGYNNRSYINKSKSVRTLW